MPAARSAPRRRIAPWSSPTRRSRAASPRAGSRSTRTTPSLLQPSSVDVRVDRLFRVFHNNRYPYIDVKVEQEELTELVEVDGDHPFVLHPGEFVLGSTLERVRLPDDLVARLEGKSSLGRLGLLIHSTAGFIDPGWDGHVTLELSNVANLPITIYPGMKIGQISFMQMTEPATTPYGSAEIGSKYKGQRGPTPSRYWKNFDRRMTVLVTGGTGFVGRHVVHALRARELPVRALVRDPRRASRLAAWGAELVEGDVTDPASLARGVRRAPTRSSTSSRSSGLARRLRARDGAGHARPRRGGAGGGRAALRAHERARARRADAGRGAVLRARSGRWSAAVQESGLEHVIFRPSFVFGKDGGVLPTFVRLARLAPVTPIVGDGDAAAAADLGRRRRRVLRAVARPAGGGEPHVRARRPGRVDLERVLGRG